MNVSRWTSFSFDISTFKLCGFGVFDLVGYVGIALPLAIVNI